MKKGTKKIAKNDYQHFLDEVVDLVYHHRTKAVLSVQAIANQMYWNIGELILRRQAEFGWGNAVVEQLSKDLNRRLGEGVSWSPRNLRFMRQLVEEYSNVKQPVSHLKSTDGIEIEVIKSKNEPFDGSNMKQPVSHLKITDDIEIEYVKSKNGPFGGSNMKQPVSHLEVLKQLVLEVPWGHNILLLQKVKDLAARIFYLQSTIKNRYSRAVFLHQINADAYKNHLLHPSKHNFAAALPQHLQEQTQESIKSVYVLDFLDANKPMSERQLESTMVEKVKRVMMELGYGFCFIGNQYRLNLGEKEYFTR